MKQESLEYLSELVETDAQGEAAIQSLIAKSMEQSGCAVEFYDYFPNQVPVTGEFSTGELNNGKKRRVLIATAKGDPALPSLLIFAHPEC